MNRTTLVGFVLAIGMITLGLPAVAEQQPDGGPDFDVDFDEVDCNPTKFADVCPKSGHYLDIDTMDVYAWDSGSSISLNLMEEYRPPSLTNTGTKASGYTGYVWSWPYYEGESMGAPNEWCDEQDHGNLVDLCVAARITVLGPICAFLHVSHDEAVRQMDGSYRAKEWVSVVPLGCELAVLFRNLVHFEYTGLEVCTTGVASWIQFSSSPTSAMDPTKYGYQWRDAGENWGTVNCE